MKPTIKILLSLSALAACLHYCTAPPLQSRRRA